MGFEPMNTGFADQRVSHFATGAHVATLMEVWRLFFLLLRLRYGTQVRLNGFVPRKDLVCVFVGYSSGNDDILALLPVGRRRDLMLHRQLQ